MLCHLSCAVQVTAERASTPSAQLQGLDPQQQRIPVISPAYSSRRLRGADHTHSVLAGPHLHLTYGHSISMCMHKDSDVLGRKTAGQHALTRCLSSYTGAHHTQCCLSFRCRFPWHFSCQLSQGKISVADAASLLLGAAGWRGAVGNAGLLSGQRCPHPATCSAVSLPAADYCLCSFDQLFCASIAHMCCGIQSCTCTTWLSRAAVSLFP